MSNSQWIFIVNPVSGKGRAEKVQALAEKFISPKGIRFKIEKTTHRNHAHELAHFYRDKAQVIIAVGGDGTINEVGSALVHTQTVLGIIPCGSGNGLARSLQIPLKMGAAVKHLSKATIKNMDVGQLNDKIFLCVCGFGFDALVAHKFASAGKRGLRTYVNVVKNEYRKYASPLIAFEINGEKYAQPAFMFSIANAPQFGNNFFINPMANVFDGNLNLTIIKPFKSLRALNIAMAMRSKKTHRLREFATWEGKSFIVHSPYSYGHIDGEPVEIEGPQTISVQPGALKILC